MHSFIRLYIKHSSIRIYIKQGIHPSGYTLNRTFIYQISQGHLACGSRSSGGGLLLPMQMPGPSTISFSMRRSRSSAACWEASCCVIAENLFCTDVACLTLLRACLRFRRWGMQIRQASITRSLSDRSHPLNSVSGSSANACRR